MLCSPGLPSRPAAHAASTPRSRFPPATSLDLADRSLLPGAQYCWHCKAPLDVDEDDEGAPFEPTWDPGDYTPGGPGPLNAILDHVIARLEGVPL